VLHDALARGPFYELQDYILKPDGLPATIDIWTKAIEARATKSPVSAVMYSLTGSSPRFVYLWPYTSLDEPQRLRTQAMQMGVWPPPGGPDRLVSQQSSILLPAPFSPMQ
jgi:NIPSNAP